MTLHNLVIDKSIISLMATGSSIHGLSANKKKSIQKYTFTIGINDFDLFKPDARIWWDINILKHFLKNRKYIDNTILITRQAAIEKGLQAYIYAENEVETTMTFYIALQLCRKYFPDKIILLYGLDCYNEKFGARNYNAAGNICKMEGEHYGGFLNTLKNKLESRYIDDKKFFDGVWNCNALSAVNIPKCEEVSLT